MGIFSNLFKKKENPQPAAKVSFVEKTGLASHDPEIPPFQGDYAKTISFGRIIKRLPLKEMMVMRGTFCMSVEFGMQLSIIKS